jgi:hypothetical protein
MNEAPPKRKRYVMEILIINFSLDGITEQEYRQVCNDVAPAFAAVPGLQSKVWLADGEANVYGGVYAFESDADVDRFLSSQLFSDIAAHPSLADPVARRFHVLEEPTRVTNGLAPATA